MNYQKLLNKRNFTILLVLYLLCLLGFQLILRQLEQQSGTSRIPDTFFHYSTDEVKMLLEQYGSTGRRLYFYSLMIDLVYPLVYGAILWMIITALFQSLSLPASSCRFRLNKLPLGAAFFDYMENLAELIMLHRFPAGIDRIAPVAALFTSVKWSLVILSLLVVLVSGIRVLVRKITPKRVR